MATPARTKTVGEIVEILFVDLLQQHRHGLRYDLIDQGRNTERTELFSVPLGNPASNHRLGLIRPVDKSLVQYRQVRFQITLVLVPGDPINASGAVRFQAPERTFQHRHIEVVGQRVELHLRILLCLFRDPSQSWPNGWRVRCPGPLCLGSEVTPGLSFATPGPADRVGSLASRIGSIQHGR